MRHLFIRVAQSPTTDRPLDLLEHTLRRSRIAVLKIRDFIRDPGSHTQRLEFDSGVAFVGIDHPPINLLDDVLSQEFDKLGSELEVDESVRVVVLQSAFPDFFIAHSGLGRVGAASKTVPHTRSFRLTQTIGERFRNMPKVTIAKVEGRARAAGVKSRWPWICALLRPAKRSSAIQRWRSGSLQAAAPPKGYQGLSSPIAPTPERFATDCPFPGLRLEGRVRQHPARHRFAVRLTAPGECDRQFRRVVRRVPVKITFDEPGEALRWISPGMSAEAKIYTAEPHTWLSLRR